MSASFGGFTDKEIEKIRTPKKDGIKTPVKMVRKNNKLIPVHEAPPVDVVTMDNNVVEKVELNAVNVETESENISNAMVTIDLNSQDDENSNMESSNIKGIPDDILDEPNFMEKYNLFNNNAEKKPIDIEAFQKVQKLIEEQNKKRKEMLAKALEDRTKQTEEEVQRLDAIKKELQSLDAQLHDDVAILRKKIDKASIVYSETEKNYFKVEKEFLQAKLALQKEKEKKELLTEHLCTLIAHNEEKKAKKLESLMEQLVYKTSPSPSSSVCDGVCEKTGKMLEMENGQVILRDDD